MMNTIPHYSVEGTKEYDGEDWPMTSPLKEFHQACSLVLLSLPEIKISHQ
jgi:hypothetical protein